ncbi:MAG TPA: uroporphyrinogen decarboxylase family protein [Patescibacteria group bacterium]|nr:uroporphyrinogen decarboxylase family protein [Patescibacteria group bacterium]
MNAMERIGRAARGEPTDRIPVFCDLLDQGAAAVGLSSLKEYYSRGEYVAEGQLRMREKYGYDNLWSLFYVGREAELFGCRKMIYAPDGPPNVGEMVIRADDDIHKLEIPRDVTAHPSFQEVLKCVRILAREAGGKYPVIAYVTAAMTLPVLLMGMEKWMDLLLRGSPELRDELLEKCSDVFRQQIAAYREAGANVLVYSNPFGSTDFLPLKLIRTVSLPWMERDLEPGGVDGVVYYGGGACLEGVLELILDRLHIGSYCLSALDDIGRCKAITGNRAMIGGILNNIRAEDWTCREIREEVKKVVEAGKDGGRFYFGTLALPYHTPEANIREIVAAAMEYGTFDGGRNHE